MCRNPVSAIVKIFRKSLSRRPGTTVTAAIKGRDYDRRQPRSRSDGRHRATRPAHQTHLRAQCNRDWRTGSSCAPASGHVSDGCGDLLRRRPPLPCRAREWQAHRAARQDAGRPGCARHWPHGPRSRRLTAEELAQAAVKRESEDPPHVWEAEFSSGVDRPKRPDASEKPHRGRTPGTVALKYRRQSSVREEGGTLVYETVDTNPVIAKKKEKHVEVCLRQPKRRNKSDDTSPVTDFGGSMRLDTNARG